MKKTIALLLVMILSAGALSAKPREKGEIRAVEFEIGGGFVFGNHMKNFVNDGGCLCSSRRGTISPNFRST